MNDTPCPSECGVMLKVIFNVSRASITPHRGSTSISMLAVGSRQVTSPQRNLVDRAVWLNSSAVNDVAASRYASVLTDELSRQTYTRFMRINQPASVVVARRR